MTALVVFWFNYYLQSLYEIQVDEGRWQEVNRSLCRLECMTEQSQYSTLI